MYPNTSTLSLDYRSYYSSKGSWHWSKYLSLSGSSPTSRPRGLSEFYSLRLLRRSTRLTYIDRTDDPFLRFRCKLLIGWPWSGVVVKCHSGNLPVKSRRNLRRSFDTMVEIIKYRYIWDIIVETDSVRCWFTT